MHQIVNLSIAVKRCEKRARYCRSFFGAQKFAENFAISLHFLASSQDQAETDFKENLFFL